MSATAERGEDLRGKRRRGRHIHDRIFVPEDNVGCSIGAGNFVKKNCRRNRNQFVVFPAICTNDILAALGASLYHIETSPCMERVWRWCLPIQCHAFLFPVCPPRSLPHPRHPSLLRPSLHSDYARRTSKHVHDDAASGLLGTFGGWRRGVWLRISRFKIGRAEQNRGSLRVHLF